MKLKFLKKYPSVVVCLLIFVISATVYLSNGVTITSGDTVPTTFLAFNFLSNHTIHLDPLRGGYIYQIYHTDIAKPPYFFSESSNGHLTSSYPIGTALITFPLYTLFYAYLKLAHIPVELNSSDFEVHRLFFEKLAATIVASTTVVIFYLATRLKFSRSSSLVTTFIFAFATNQWMISSQGLWQHGTSNLAIATIIFCLLKANRTAENNRRVFLLVAGVACGLMPGIRPTSSIFSLAAIVYSVFTYRTQSIWFCLGLPSALLSFTWNLYYFGNLLGGYTAQLSTYSFTPQQFLGGFLGLTISPSRGILVLTPVILYSFTGAYRVFKSLSGSDEKLFGSLTIASMILFVNYCFFTWWSGLHCYSARFLTDTLPVMCYLLNYSSAFQWCLDRRKYLSRQFIIFLSVLLFSTFSQVAGAYGFVLDLWNAIPVSADEYDYRNWDIKDTMVTRNAGAIFYRNFKPPVDSPSYIQGLSGVIQQVQQVKDTNTIYIKFPVAVKSASKMVVKAEVENTGVSMWYGYETGMQRGTVRVRIGFYDSSKKKVSESFLDVSGMPKQNETAIALGTVEFPQSPGTYKLGFDFILNGVTDFPNTKKGFLYQLDVSVSEKEKEKEKL